MHIPPYHKKPGWQRFLVGIFFGALISYWVVIFMYGTMYEKLLEENSTLQKNLDDAEDKIIALNKDNEDSKKPISVEKIDLEILNAEELKMDMLLQHQLEGLIKKEVDTIIGKDVQTISESDALLISSIENKSFKIDDFSYRFEVKRIIFFSTVKIITKAKISD